MDKRALFEKHGIFHKGMRTKDIKECFANHLEYSLSKDQYTATDRDLYFSLALTVRERIIEQWIKTQQLYYYKDAKRVYYLSAEFLMGRALVNNLINLDLLEKTKKAVEDLGLDFDELVEQEPDAGLGNGGLGRLAACFLDSMATLEIPAYGYGIRYEFGIFEQVIRDFGQVELPDSWLKFGNPWEIERPEYSFPVKFYGKINTSKWPDGQLKKEWVDTDDVIGIAYDTPVCGYDNYTVNTMRLWSSRASNEFDLNYFQHGDYLKAVEEKNISENISKVLYPNDSNFVGRELRLKQQYFFVSCSIQDIIRRYLVNHKGFHDFHKKVAIQLNDTHPSLAILELMRIFVDEYQIEWNKAWEITTKTCAYTNHTILSEALEKWPVEIFGTLLPRHMEIVYEINRLFLKDVSIRFKEDKGRASRLSIIGEDSSKRIRMAHLAIVGSHSVNGVAALHTKLLKEGIFREFEEVFPGRINNKTNGITPRRWLLAANPELAGLITKHIGDGWVSDLSQIRKIEPLAADPDFQKAFDRIKKTNKEGLAGMTLDLTGEEIDPDSIFDVQIKRIHEYKRQMLNILHVITCWLRLKNESGFEMHPRTFFFAGKTAPDYYISKMVIKLICHAAEIINRDPVTKGIIKVVFLPNYCVSLAEKIIPAADLSEQISTAGYEASGTGNMKLSLNGALTIGTLDGANIEILEEVGKENIFIFGHTADEIREMAPTYNARAYYDKNPLLKETVDMISRGFFSPAEPGLFGSLISNLLNTDHFLTLADFESYGECQIRAGKTYYGRTGWIEKAILNVARMGKFSSDRTIQEYNRDIWKAQTYTIPYDRPKKKTDPVSPGKPARKKSKTK
ncbi:MAG: glycogen/starch/alpha-glucan phosphorylase [Candidatus Krumholzibacteriota bacterium]|nr:glycogen/starch/alpha-glucan phosphorylase [Candidatus Krumholzibacteriota bacterium]